MATKSEKQREMYSLIESWKASGASQQEFCKSQGLAYSAFHYWYKKYRQDKIAVPLSEAFISVALQPNGSGSPIVELIMADGRRLNFYQAVDASFLRMLLS